MVSATRAAAATALLALAQGLRQAPFGFDLFKPKTPLLIVGVHHEMGWELFEPMAATKPFIKAFGSPMDLQYDQVMGKKRCTNCIGLARQQPSADNVYASQSRVYRNIDDKALQKLRESKRPYRMVHIIREPMNLVIEGYFHHRNTHDAPRMEHMTGPEILKKTTLFTGMQQEARAELNGTLSEVYKVMAATRSDPHVLTLGIEDFEDNFTKAATCMYSFLQGDQNKDISELLEASKVVARNTRDQRNKERFAPGSKFSNQELWEAAASVADYDPDPVWRKIHEMRDAFGYQPVKNKGWRFHQQFCDRFA